MKRCKTCIWWTDISAKGGWGDCGKAASEGASPVDDTSLAVAYDFEGYMASLQTAANFGCVQWKVKGSGK